MIKFNKNNQHFLLKKKRKTLVRTTHSTHSWMYLRRRWKSVVRRITKPALWGRRVEAVNDADGSSVVRWGQQGAMPLWDHQLKTTNRIAYLNSLRFCITSLNISMLKLLTRRTSLNWAEQCIIKHALHWDYRSWVLFMHQTVSFPQKQPNSLCSFQSWIWNFKEDAFPRNTTKT